MNPLRIAALDDHALIAAKCARSHKTSCGQMRAALRKLELSKDLELFRINSRLAE